MPSLMQSKTLLLPSNIFLVYLALLRAIKGDEIQPMVVDLKAKEQLDQGMSLPLLLHLSF